MKRLLCLLVLAVRTCSPVPAEQLMVPLERCEAELTLQEQKFQQILTQLENDFAERLLTTAAETAKPLLIQIAGVRAERDVALEAVKVGQGRVWRVSTAFGVAGVVLGLVVGLLIK